jgi:hypothetical protein
MFLKMKKKKNAEDPSLKVNDGMKFCGFFVSN